MNYSPSVDDYRITKEPDEGGRRWVWRFEIDGMWEFISSMTEEQAGDFVEEKKFLREDATYDYWH